jgi:hypothetical protein
MYALDPQMIGEKINDFEFNLPVLTTSGICGTHVKVSLCQVMTALHSNVREGALPWWFRK